MHLSRKILRGFLVLFVTALVLLVIAVIWVGSSFLSFDFNDGYAQWGAADMVIEYMETHDGHWPPNWEALRENFESGRGYLGHVGGTFEQFQKRIFIDFQADPEELRKQSLASDNAKFDVIHAGWGSVQFGEGPNAVLRSYFRRKAGIIDAPVLPAAGQLRTRRKSQTNGTSVGPASILTSTKMSRMFGRLLIL